MNVNTPLSRRRLLALSALALLSALPATAQKKGPFALGAKPSPQAAIQKFGAIKVRTARDADRPRSLVLTEFLPPVGNQNPQLSCVGWSTAYYAYTYAVAMNLGLKPEQIARPEWQFSYRYIWNQGNGGVNQGMFITTAMQILKDQGCATLKEMPVDLKETTEKPTPAAMKRAQRFVARSIGALPTNDVEQLKSYLAEMRCPFVIAIPIYWEDFPKGGAESGFVYKHSGSSAPDGSHAITIIGYDEDKRAFRMINSWGEDWGDKGQLWLDEDFIAKEAREAWGFVAGGPTSRFVIPKTVQFVPRKPAPRR